MEPEEGDTSGKPLGTKPPPPPCSPLLPPVDFDDVEVCWNTEGVTPVPPLSSGEGLVEFFILDRVHREVGIE